MSKLTIIVLIILVVTSVYHLMKLIQRMLTKWWDRDCEIYGVPQFENPPPPPPPPNRVCKNGQYSEQKRMQEVIERRPVNPFEKDNSEVAQDIRTVVKYMLPNNDAKDDDIVETYVDVLVSVFKEHKDQTDTFVDPTITRPNTSTSWRP